MPYLARFGPARRRATLVPLAILIAILPLSWIAALALLLAAPVIPLFMALIGWQAEAAARDRLVRAGDMNSFLLDRLRGLDTIRALGAVDRTAARLRREAERFRAGTMAVLRIAFLSSAVLELFAALGVAMVAVWVGFHLLGTVGFGAWASGCPGQGCSSCCWRPPSSSTSRRELAAVQDDRASGAGGAGALDRLAGTRRCWSAARRLIRLRRTLAAALGDPVAGLCFRRPGGTRPRWTGSTSTSPWQYHRTSGRQRRRQVHAACAAGWLGRVRMLTIVIGGALTAETALRFRAGMALGSASGRMSSKAA